MTELPDIPSAVLMHDYPLLVSRVLQEKALFARTFETPGVNVMLGR